MFVEHSEKHEAQRIMVIHDKLLHSVTFFTHMAWWTAAKARGAAVKARGSAVKARGPAVKARARRGYGGTKGSENALNTRPCAH